MKNKMQNEYQSKLLNDSLLWFILNHPLTLDLFGEDDTLFELEKLSFFNIVMSLSSLLFIWRSFKTEFLISSMSYLFYNCFGECS
jgi:hypothetical protein